jgi:hypothetical protein
MVFCMEMRERGKVVLCWLMFNDECVMGMQDAGSWLADARGGLEFLLVSISKGPFVERTNKFMSYEGVLISDQFT